MDQRCAIGAQSDAGAAPMRLRLHVDVQARATELSDVADRDRLTHNVRHFVQVPGLQLEDWMAVPTAPAKTRRKQS